MNFVKEFQELILKSPTYNLRAVQDENCPYVHMISFSRNSYMCFGGYKCEDCGYCHYPNQLRDCWDTYFAIQCELCYECVSCTGCYNADFCTECVNCSDCKFCYDCKACKNCFGCVGLRQKEYFIFNKKYSPREYEEKIKSIKKEDAEQEAEKLRLKYPHLCAVISQSEECIGDHIIRSKNCNWAFATTDSEDCAYVFHNDHLKDVYDTDLMANSELLYECNIGYDLYGCNFMLECGNVKESEYCVRCFNSNHLFGCAARDHASYEILNKKYSEKDWHEKVAEIKAELKKQNEYKNFLPDIIENL